MLEGLRFLILILLFVTGCSSPTVPAVRDLTKEPWYGEVTTQLTDLNRSAGEAFKHGQADKAAKLIQQGEPLAKRLMEASHPTLGAVEGASDLDDIYGRMLLSNRHYGWARLMFQKNLARWKNWTPATEESARRLKQAMDAIAECDRHIE
jgi:hypothetical protein